MKEHFDGKGEQAASTHFSTATHVSYNDKYIRAFVDKFSYKNIATRALRSMFYVKRFEEKAEGTGKRENNETNCHNFLQTAIDSSNKSLN